MFHSLVDFGGRYIHPNNNADKEYTEICSKHVDRTTKNFFIKIGLMLLALHGSMIGPIYGYVVHGTKTTMTNVLIPYVERGSNAEFTYNVMLASIIGTHGFCGYIGLEVAMALFTDVVTIAPKLIEHEFERLNILMEKQNFSNCQLRHTINNIIKQALDSDEYIMLDIFNTQTHWSIWIVVHYIIFLQNNFAVMLHVLGIFCTIEH